MMEFSQMRSVAWNTTAEMLGLTLSDVLTGASSAKFLRGDGTWAGVTATALTVSTTDRLIGRDSAGSGASEELTVSGGIEFTGLGGIQTSAFTGDVTKTAGGTALTLASVVSASTNTKITYNAKGLVTAGAAAILASSDYANQGTTTTVLHGNASGNPTFGAVAIGADVSGLGTGIATALAVNTGSAGAPVLFNGALGTPSSGTATNLTGTAASLNVGTAATWTTARNLAGNSVNGSANVAFANKFIVQGTTDTGLSAAQFLGALGTGIVKNTTTTGVLSIAVAGDFPTLNQNTSGTAAGLSVVLVPASGGTGIANNNASTLTISGNFATTLTVSGITGVTLPATGTLATLAGAEELTNKTLNASVGKGTWTASGTWTLPALTLGGAITYGGVTLSNAVVGTGSMVLSAGPTFTGTLAAATMTSTGTYTQTAAVNTDPTIVLAGSGAYNSRINFNGSSVGGVLNVLSGGNMFVQIASATVGNFTSTGLNSAAIGATTASTGAFTTLNVTTGGSTTISTGVGVIHMSTANPATNAAWIAIASGGTTYFVPAWTTNSP